MCSLINNVQKNMMTKNSLNLLGLFSLFLLVVASCTKQSDNLGLGVLPEEDILSVYQTDTLSIIAHTFKRDSLRSDEFSAVMLGNMYDPVFGSFRASTMVQFALSTDGVSSTANIVVDSVVLSLTYIGNNYGEDNQQSLVVQENMEQLNKDSAYYSNHQVNVLGDNLIDPEKQVVDLYTGNIPPGTSKTLNIRLSKYFGDRLIHGDPSTLANNTAFQQYFKGLYISSSGYNCEVANFDLRNPGTKLTVYGKDRTQREYSQYRYDFIVTDQCAYFSKLDQSYYGSEMAFLESNDSVLTSTTCYFLASLGARVSLFMPYLSTLNQYSNRTINKAELVIPFMNEKSTDPPNRIWIFRQGPSGELYTIADESEISYSNFSAGQYKLNITRYLQRYLNGDYENNGLVIIPEDQGNSLLFGIKYATANRVRLHGPEFNLANPLDNMRLIVTFTD
jgi:hypothetical protein